MIPCLYDISETSYVTNGIGKMADCISCIVTEKRNGSYELKMEYPSDGIHADEITEGAIILAKPADSKSPQPFRIYKITTPMDGKLEIAARHISYQLNFITVSPVTVVSGTDEQVVLAYQGLLDNASTECPFSFETDMSSTAYFGILEPTSFRNALGGVDGSMLDTFGGEFEWDMYTVRLLKNRGSDNGVRIVYGKNLIDFKMEKSIEEVITGVHPFWKNSESDEIMELSEKVVTLADTDYPYEKIMVLDCTEQFEEQPTESSLRSYAQSYLESTSYTEPDIDIDIDFAQLWQTPGYEDIAEAERVSLCDTVHVYVSKLGIEMSATVTETEYDTLLERYKSITLSNAVSSSRNSSLSLSVATTSQVKTLIAITDSAIRLSNAATYVTQDELNSDYSTTVEVKSLIEETEEAITISYDKKLESYSTTEEVKSLIEVSEEGILLSVSGTYATQKSLQEEISKIDVNASLALEIATDASGKPYGKLSANVDYVEVSAGEFVISGSNGGQFTFDAEGNATFSGKLKAASGTFSGSLSCEDGYIGGWTIGENSIYRSGDGYTCYLSGAGSASGNFLAVTNSSGSAYFVVYQNGTMYCQTCTASNGFTGNLNGTASSAEKLSSGFNLTLGDIGKTVRGNEDVSFTLAEIGAAAADHDHSDLDGCVKATSTSFLPTSDGTMVLGYSNYRWSAVYSNTATIQTSDANEKRNIEDIGQKYEELFLKLRPRTYMWKNFKPGDHHDRVHCGLIAQEVESACHDVGLDSVSFAALCRDDLEQPTVDGRMERYSIAYAELHGLEIHMLQKAWKEIEDQNVRIKDLETQIRRMA